MNLSYNGDDIHESPRTSRPVPALRSVDPGRPYGLDCRGMANYDSHVFVLSLRCMECGGRWDDVNERWRVYFTDDEPPEPITYCPRCAQIEFGD
jgi:hypothetical protein